jgi:hypothetical protein
LICAGYRCTIAVRWHELPGMEGNGMFTHVELVTLDGYGNEAVTVLEGSLPDIVSGILAIDPGSLLSARYVR